MKSQLHRTNGLYDFGRPNGEQNAEKRGWLLVCSEGGKFQQTFKARANEVSDTNGTVLRNLLLGQELCQPAPNRGGDYLALLQFFLNHRRFVRGEHSERVGKSPAELLTGKEHPHWLEMLGYQ